jgi:lipopolysaccharide transport protein LptA
MSLSALHASRFLSLCLLAFPAAGQEPARGSYEVDCDSLSGNVRDEESVGVGCEFTNGEMLISAGLATTNKFDLDGSLWRLSDNVRLAFGTTEILAADALLRFEQNDLVLSELSGNPVVMTDYIEERDIAVRGSAQSISYDSRSGTVHLSGQATIKIGENEVIGCEWIYNFNDKSYRAGTTDECDEGIRLLLTPPEDSDDPDDQSGAP